jgi:hypothetical protein
MPITQNEEVVRFLADLLIKLVSNEVSVPQAVRMVNKFVDSLPVEQRSDARAYLTHYVFGAQESMQKEQQLANRPWQEFSDDDLPWQEREPWRTIKRGLPPQMIDTPDKERKAAWRIGYLMGCGAVNATAAAIREYGLTSGMGVNPSERSE